MYYICQTQPEGIKDFCRKLLEYKLHLPRRQGLMKCWAEGHLNKDSYMQRPIFMAMTFERCIPIGAAMLLRSFTSDEFLTGFYVPPPYRRRGIATGLHLLMHRYAEHNGFDIPYSWRPGTFPEPDEPILTDTAYRCAELYSQQRSYPHVENGRSEKA